MAKFIDAHTHLQFLSYDADRDEVLRRAKEAGVRMITVGTQFSTSLAGVRLAEKYPEDIWATVAFHPAHFNSSWHHDKNEQEASSVEEFDAEKLKELAKHPKVVAIGECGLDYFRVNDDVSKARQKEGFLAHIEIAREVGKPLMIHCRSAFADLIEILKANSSKLKADFPGVIHSFDGTLEDAKQLLDLGFCFTFAGNITFKPRPNYPLVAEVITFLPMDKILSETDAPYLTPIPYRGKRNEPAYVIEVVRKLAEIKGVSMKEIKDTIFNNAQRIFSWELYT